MDGEATPRPAADQSPAGPTAPPTVGRSGPQWPAAETLVGGPAERAERPRRWGPLAKGAAVLATGLVAGAIGVATIQGIGGATGGPASTAAARSGDTGSPAAPGSGGGSGSGDVGGATGGHFLGGGGRDGETRLLGTLAAVGATSVTVQDRSGARSTIPVDGTTQIALDGQQVALAALRAGEPVLVHVLPTAAGGTVAERVLAASSGAAVAGPGDGQGGSGAGSGAAAAEHVAFTA